VEDCMEKTINRSVPQWVNIFRSQLLQRTRSQLLGVPEPQWPEEPGLQHLERPWPNMVVGPVVQYSSHLRTRPQPPGGPGWQPVPRPDLGSWRDLESSRRDRKSRGWSDIYHWCCLCPSLLKDLECVLICKR
jgi:hypothetical protein